MIYHKQFTSMCFSVFGLVLSLYCLLLLMEFMVFVLAEKMWEKKHGLFPYLKLLGWGILMFLNSLLRYFYSYAM